MDLVPLATPALAIVCIAIIITVRDRRAHDVVLDLTDDVPTVRLSESHQASRGHATPPAPVTGDLVPAGGASLGGRLQHVAAEEQQRERPPSTDRPARQVVVRRRRTALVAARRAD